jgi:hypothetical protein
MSGGPLPSLCAQAAGDNSTAANAMASRLRLFAFMASLLFCLDAHRQRRARECRRTGARQDEIADDGLYLA